jgi:hypothetical protein
MIGGATEKNQPLALMLVIALGLLKVCWGWDSWQKIPEN